MRWSWFSRDNCDCAIAWIDRSWALATSRTHRFYSYVDAKYLPDAGMCKACLVMKEPKMANKLLWGETWTQIPEFQPSAESGLPGLTMHSVFNRGMLWKQQHSRRAGANGERRWNWHSEFCRLFANWEAEAGACAVSTFLNIVKALKSVKCMEGQRGKGSLRTMCILKLTRAGHLQNGAICQ